METKLEAYEENQKDRFRWKVYSIAFWIIYGIVGSLFSYFILDIKNYLFVIGYLGFFANFLLYSRNLPREKYETIMCAYFSKASNFVKLSQQEKGKVAKRYRKKSASQIKKALKEMNHLMIKAETSEIMEKNIHRRLSTLKTNIERLVLPRVINGENLQTMKSTLKNLARFFGGRWETLGIDHLDQINEELESSGSPSKETRTFVSTLQDSVRRKPITIGLSIATGFVITTLIIGVICRVVSIDFVEWIRLNLQAFMLAGIGMSAIISQVLVRD